MPATIFDIARSAGVSVVTVSRVINHYPSVRESNRLKVLSAMKELGYQPNAAARTLARGKTGMIGMVIPDLADTFMAQIMSSAEKTLKEKGLLLVVSSAAKSPDLLESGCARLFTEYRVDGIIIQTPILNDSYILELEKRKIPFVLLDQYQLNMQVPTIVVDNFSGGYEATECLIKSGAKKIAHITGNAIYESSRERTRGFLQALGDHRIESRSEWMVQGDFSVTCGYHAVRTWIEAGCLPDAVFASDDNTAFGILDAAREYGIDVPGSLSIIGYDDHPYASLLHPGISTIRQPSERIGSAAAELLMDLIEGRPARTKITLKPFLILRGTTK